MSVLEVNGCAWDRFDGYLFDIDGTLMNCMDAVHYFAFCDALSAVAGKPMTLDGVMTQGNTDNGILRGAFTLAGIDEATWQPRLAETHARMGRFVRAKRNEFNINVLPGVREVLEHLQSRGTMLGVATGNLRAIGRLKLEHAGLLEFFTIEGFSDAFETRAEVFRAAAEKMRAAAGSTATVCVLGDTPADIEAAQAIGLPVIATATGIFDYETLLALKPDLCVSSLAQLLQEKR